MIVVNLFGVPGSGKCFGINTPVLMYDGTIKNIQDINIGDIVMGDDSTPRNVVDLHSGKSNLYKIKRNFKGLYSDVVVSNDHILVTKRKMVKSKKWITQQDTIQDFMKKSNVYVGRSCLFKETVHYPEKDLKLEPYYIGLWLGDGVSSKLNCITTADVEIKEYIEQYAKRLGLKLTRQESKESKCNSYSLSEGNNGNHSNHPIYKHNKLYNLLNNKHIPIEYLTSSMEQRLQLLAGLIDSDGYMRNYVEIMQKSKVLSEDIMLLANTCGFRAYINKVKKSCQNGFTGEYYKITISGDFSKVPVLLDRKRPINATLKKNYQCSRFAIEDIGIGNYYGIETDGNKLFCLGDCTVVHNSSGAAYIFSKLKFAGINVELITEFAKDKVYEENVGVFKDQLYIFGKQHFKQSRLVGSVDVAVTDSPIPLSVFYNTDTEIAQPFDTLVRKVFDKYDNMSYFIRRTKPYNPSGRFQTEEQSDAMVDDMLKFSQSYSDIKFIDGEESGYDLVVRDVLNRFS